MAPLPEAVMLRSGRPASSPIGSSMNSRAAVVLIFVVSIAMSGPLLAAAPAFADDTTCRGTIGAKHLDGNVIVPQGATCTLAGTRVDGNVFVHGNATLYAKGVKVGGSIQAENHRWVVVRPRTVDGQAIKSRIDGSIQLKQGGGGKLLRNVVNADVQLFSNDGQFSVQRNVIDGNLQCKSNDPKPVGGNNKVEGNKEDQCKNL